MFLLVASGVARSRPWRYLSSKWQPCLARSASGIVDWDCDDEVACGPG